MRSGPHEHVSLGGQVLDHDLRNFQGICDKNRQNLLVKHFIDGDSRSTVSIQPVHVTTEERYAAEDIGNATKEEILRRADEKVQLLSDEEVKYELLKRLGDFRKQISRIKKDTMLAFYEEIIEELDHQDTSEAVCQRVEVEDGD